MSTGASQIDVEIVREALAILGQEAEPFLIAPMGENQTTDLISSDHVEWRDGASGTAWISDGSGKISVSTGAGQAAGIITLAPGLAYMLTAELGVEMTGSSSSAQVQWRRVSGSPQQLGAIARIDPLTLALNRFGANIIRGIADLRAASASEDVETLIIASSGLTSITHGNNRGTVLTIHAL